MKKLGKVAQESLMDKMKKFGKNRGVKISDLSERGVRAIGIIGGLNKALGCQCSH